MIQINKKNIAIFFGGCSPEYEVSLQSAYAVITHIDTTLYTPILIGLEQHNGQWFWYRGDVDAIQADSWYTEQTCTPVYPATNKAIQGLHYFENQVLKTLSLDAALPILHGKNGEDGTVQAVLELSGIPVIGCNLLSSALCMDKVLAHQLVSAAGIPSARSFSLTFPYDTSQLKEDADSLGYPLFVKPVRAGSSFGITRVTAEAELLPAVKLAFRYDSEVVLEEMISGFEVGCAILGNKEPLIGEVDEIELSDGFFDYTEKYTLKSSQIHVPARISSEVADTIKQTALTIYRVLGCSGFARVDLFLTNEGLIYFNEVNTIPGFTAHSRFPNMLKAAGFSFDEIIRRLLEMVV